MWKCAPKKLTQNLGHFRLRGSIFLVVGLKCARTRCLLLTIFHTFKTPLATLTYSALLLLKPLSFFLNKCCQKLPKTRLSYQSSLSLCSRNVDLTRWASCFLLNLFYCTVQYMVSILYFCRVFSCFSCDCNFLWKGSKISLSFSFSALQLNFPPNWKQVLELNPLSHKILQNLDIPVRTSLKLKSLGYKITMMFRIQNNIKVQDTK